MDLLQFFLTGSSSAIKLQKLTGRHKIRVDEQQQQQESKQERRRASLGIISFLHTNMNTRPAR
jgi:hypothetical protein